MSIEASDLEQFHQFVSQQLARGKSELTPEDCLEAWRVTHPLPVELAESLAAIEEGLEQVRRGEGVDIDEFAQRFRNSRGIPSGEP